ncbi:collagen alpha-1(XXVIII) chain-like [Argonauta hians]
MLRKIAITFLLVIGLLKEIREVTAVEQMCSGQAANIMFLLDSSSSIWSVDYERQLSFIKNLVDNFHIESHDKAVRVGAITFSDNAYLEFPIDRYDTSDQIKAAINRIPYRRGVTNTHLALELAAKEIEMKRKNFKAPFIVVVITDGQSRNVEATKKAAEILRKSGVHIYAIGVGVNYDLNELQEIASDPVENVYQVSNYSALQGIVKLFGAKTCRDIIIVTSTETPTTTTTQVPTTTTTQVPTTTTTQAPTTTTTEVPTEPKTKATTTTKPTTPKLTDDDIMVGDESVSKKDTHTISFGFDLVFVGVTRANMILEFISSILPYQPFGFFAIISEYECQGPNSNFKRLNIPLTQVGNKTQFHTAAPIKWHLPGMSSITRQLVSNLYNRNINNAYKGVQGHEVTVLFFDSSMTLLTPELEKNIQSLKRLGSKVYIVDIGDSNWADPKFVQSLSSQPSKQFTFKAPTYGSLLDKSRFPTYKFFKNCRC